MAGMDTGAIQTAAYNQAGTAFNNAVTSVNNMTNYLNNSWWTDSLGIDQPPAVAPGQINYIADAARVRQPSLPGFDGINAPGAPVLAEFTVPDIGTIPELTVVEPILDMPLRPSSTLPGAPTGAPEFHAPAIPAAPTLTLPAVPTFAPVALPDAPTLDIPLFDATADFGDIVAPTSYFEYSEREYSSALLDAQKAKLLNDLQNGGYGIEPEDERRLWERARERELQNANMKLSELSRMHAARGFMMPQGAYIEQTHEAQQELFEKVSTLSRDIAIKRADMFVENRKFTIQEVRQLEQILINYAAGVAERALNASRLQVELGVAIFNAQVSRFNAKMEEFRTYAQVYETRIRAGLAAVEIYKAKVEGARLSTEVQKLHADIYQTQINGLNATANLYKTQVEAGMTLAQIEKLKLEAFQTQVEVYAEQVRAKVAEFSMFKASIDGELAKVQLYDSSVRAYSARLGAVETKARVVETRARTEIAQTSAKVDIYRSQMDAYKTEVGVASEKIRAVLSQYEASVREYAAYMDAIKAGADNDTRAHEATARNYVAYSAVVAERLKVMIDHTLKDMEIHASSHNQAASVAAQLGGAWASAVTGLSATIETA